MRITCSSTWLVRCRSERPSAQCRRQLQLSFALPVRRWFLTNNFIYIMHSTIGVCCVVAMWATLCLFAARLWRALGSGKRWSPRRRSMCTYTAALVAMQVEHPPVHADSP